ncbi:hypothetical protein [Pseudoxanthomonas suwonensis]|uniref:HMA domain-containing protein n=1 Tax=Pseudoxanthomonas suwonensis TaxID=314722 RepID=A0A0E3UMU0_9GAMM|nr:hypothetical protein [Pseudoxanthomonas suwonensis]AKC86365.1 hypothetical protein WQ53_05850 [Pseudoxanthomonas suwonensis]
MEFHIRIAGPRVEVEAIKRRLLDLDPAGLVDLDADSGVLRVSTLAQPAELAGVLAAVGHPVAQRDIELQPSVCCGGCSG